jgi:tetratricopeptide (TPR) repeat protein
MHPKGLQRLEQQALVALNAGRLDEAAVMLERLTRVDAISPALPFALGACETRRGNHQNAALAFEKALTRAERAGFMRLVPAAAIARAHALFAANDATTAVDAYRSIVERHPNTPQALEAGAALARIGHNGVSHA